MNNQDFVTGSPRICRDIAANRTHSRLGACVLKLRGHRHRYLRTAAAIASGVLAFPAAVHAADLPLKAPALKAVYDWTGLYIGAHAGYSRGSSSFALNDGTAINGSGVFSGMIGGVQAGYNYRLNSGWLVGVEGDFSFPNYITSNSIVSFLATHLPTRSSSSGTTPPACAAASATPAVHGSSMPPAALRGWASAISTRRPRATSRKS
ncbi:hypothetical protein ACVWXQ_005706 [Bradyrhizobium sp. S3.14.4]